ncbi:MAG: WYL domain-containing protein [Bacilli bacterium]|jgi:predicted DNA-binding transcriptional regulator YafY|nr:WYL domain-containing protein [Bacilli bacterium]
MSKLSNTLLLLSYLQNGRKYSINELSEKIEVTPRMIRSYKEELEKAGFIIETMYGPYGGYVLKKNNILVSSTFNEYDLEAVENLKRENPTSQYLEILLDKIKMILENRSEPTTKQDMNIYNILSRAIKEKRKVEIEYDSLEKGLNLRTIQPLELFYLKDGFGVAAFCEKKKDLRHFELKRIQKALLLKEKY